MELETIGGEEAIKSLLSNIRSVNEEERKLTMSQIPNLILESLKLKNDILNQLILVIYNLNTDLDIYETLNASNRTLVIRKLLRLYTETFQDQDHHHKQVEALTKIIDFAHSSELLVELAYALHKCNVNLSKEDSELVEEALATIQEKAAANLHLEALLMIHSILAIK